jgi:hypothetical protein
VNLREATSSQNKMNRVVKNDHRGVSYNSKRGKYVAQIKLDRKVLVIGSTFDDPVSACLAYRNVAIKHFGIFYKPGRCSCP